MATPTTIEGLATEPENVLNDLEEVDATDVYSAKGIAPRVFSELLTRVLNSTEAPNVVLRVLRKDLITENGITLPKGTTIKSPTEYVNYGTVDGVGKVSFKIGDVKLKLRENWTCRDIYLFVIKPKEQQNNISFIDEISKVRKNLVSDDYDCTFVAFSPHIPFKNFTEILEESKLKYVWVEPFCVKDYANMGNTLFMVRDGFKHAIPRFSSRLLLLENFDLHSKQCPLRQLQVAYQLFCCLFEDSDFSIFVPESGKIDLKERMQVNVSKLIENIRTVSFSRLQSRNARKVALIRAQFSENESEQRKVELESTVILKEDIEYYLKGKVLEFTKEEILIDAVKDKIWDYILQYAKEASDSLLEEYHDFNQAFAENITEEKIQAVSVTGRILQERVKYEDAKDYFKMALILSKVHHGGDSAEYADCLTEIGTLYRNLGEYKSALEFFVESLNVKKHFYKGTHASMGKTLSCVSLIFEGEGRMTDAIVCQRKALSLSKTYYGKEDMEVGLALANLGSMLCKEKDFDKSLNVLNQSLQITLNSVGPWHSNTALVFNNLAAYHVDNSNFKEAVEMQHKVLRIDREIYGRRDIEVANDLANLASYLSLTKEESKIHESIFYFFEALEIQLASYGKYHVVTARTLHNLALAFNDIGNTDKAFHYGKIAVAILANVVGEEHPYYIDSKEMWCPDDEEEVIDIDEDNPEGDGTGEESSVTKKLSKKSSISIIRPLTPAERAFVEEDKEKERHEEGEIILAGLRKMKNEGDLAEMLKRKDSLVEYDENNPRPSRAGRKSGRSNRRNKKRKSFFHGMEKQYSKDDIKSTLLRKSQKFTPDNIVTKLQNRSSLRHSNKSLIAKKGFGSEFNLSINWDGRSEDFEEESDVPEEEEEEDIQEVLKTDETPFYLKRRSKENTLKRGVRSKRRTPKKRVNIPSRVSLSVKKATNKKIQKPKKTKHQTTSDVTGIKDLLPRRKDFQRLCCRTK